MHAPTSFFLGGGLFLGDSWRSACGQPLTLLHSMISAMAHGGVCADNPLLFACGGLFLRMLTSRGLSLGDGMVYLSLSRILPVRSSVCVGREYLNPRWVPCCVDFPEVVWISRRLCGFPGGCADFLEAMRILRHVCGFFVCHVDFLEVVRIIFLGKPYVLARKTGRCDVDRWNFNDSSFDVFAGLIDVEI